MPAALAAPTPPPLPPPPATEQAAAHAAAGLTAEAGGDLERAEQAYWRAASIEAEPALRANYLVAHARVLLARGDMQRARPARIGARTGARAHRRQRAAGRPQLSNPGLDAGARPLHAARVQARSRRHRPARDAGPAPGAAGRSARRRERGRGAVPRAGDPEPAAPGCAQGPCRAGARARRLPGACSGWRRFFA